MFKFLLNWLSKLQENNERKNNLCRTKGGNSGFIASVNYPHTEMAKPLTARCTNKYYKYFTDFIMVMQYNWASFCPAKINHRFFLSSVSEKLLSNTRLLTTETQLIERYSTCQEQSVLNCRFAEGESLVRAFHQQTPPVH